MDYPDYKKETASKNATAICDLLNSTSAYPLQTGRAITNEHRYLQAEFWNVVEGFIQESATKHALGRYDDRNAYAVKMAAKIAPLLDQFRQEIANERRK